tara:strand:- start:11 stop:694 length:684 start_codon:yes stop_codon:yes gene_type:complete
MKTISIILSRGGSKGLKSKNILPFNGKPLLFWTIDQLKKSNEVNEIFLSSDSEEILDIGRDEDINLIERPSKFSQDSSSSESAWKHSIECIDCDEEDLIIAPQVTSPLRLKNDFDNALEYFNEKSLDSLFSAVKFEDECSWVEDENEIVPSNYDPSNRKRRQETKSTIVENGSFYIFKSGKFLKNMNRFVGKKDYFLMKHWQLFEIDDRETFDMCEKLMQTFMIKND